MTPVLGIIASSNQQGRGGGPVSAYDALATVIVPSGGLSNIVFAGIPTGYTHLQLRILARTNVASAASYMQLTFNDASTNFKAHYLDGNGSGVGSYFENTGSAINFGSITGNSATAGIFGAAIVDILDYASTSKNKVTRHLDGNDRNGAGNITFRSGLWINTSAITSIKVAPGSGSGFVQYSKFALYGVK